MPSSHLRDRQSGLFCLFEVAAFWSVEHRRRRWIEVITSMAFHITFSLLLFPAFCNRINGVVDAIYSRKKALRSAAVEGLVTHSLPNAVGYGLSALFAVGLIARVRSSRAVANI